ncbi:MAG: hypothetical protein ACI8TP_003949 [Acidimicrobiales bacterium]|jgi:hypothetical protein
MISYARTVLVGVSFVLLASCGGSDGEAWEAAFLESLEADWDRLSALDVATFCTDGEGLTDKELAQGFLAEAAEADDPTPDQWQRGVDLAVENYRAQCS